MNKGCVGCVGPSTMEGPKGPGGIGSEPFKLTKLSRDFEILAGYVRGLEIRIRELEEKTAALEPSQ